MRFWKMGGVSHSNHFENAIKYKDHIKTSYKEAILSLKVS